MRLLKEYLGHKIQDLFCRTAPPPTVAQVDAARYVGKWHEIARLPMPFQNACACEVQAVYTLDADGSLQVENSCLRADGSKMAVSGQASPCDRSGSKWQVSFLPKALRFLPFGRAPYWILRLDEHYQYVLVGTPTYRYLWILSRNPVMPEAVYADYVQTAADLGYEVNRLVRNPVSSV